MQQHNRLVAPQGSPDRERTMQRASPMPRIVQLQIRERNRRSDVRTMLENNLLRIPVIAGVHLHLGPSLPHNTTERQRLDSLPETAVSRQNQNSRAGKNQPFNI